MKKIIFLIFLILGSGSLFFSGEEVFSQSSGYGCCCISQDCSVVPLIGGSCPAGDLVLNGNTAKVREQCSIYPQSYYYCLDGTDVSDCFLAAGTNDANLKCSKGADLVGPFETSSLCSSANQTAREEAFPFAWEDTKAACLCKSPQSESKCVSAEQEIIFDQSGNQAAVSVCKGDYFTQLAKEGGYTCELVRGSIEYCVEMIDAENDDNINKPQAKGIIGAFLPACVTQDKLSGDCKDISIFIELAINIGRYVFTFVGALVLLVFIIGGFQLIISRGNPEKVKKAIDILVGAAIGLVIVFGAYMLVNFLGTAVGLSGEYQISEESK